MNTTPRFPLDRLADGAPLPEPLARARRIGLLCNQASVDHRFRYAHDVLADRCGARLAALFGPQHGLWSEQQDNMIETGHARHRRLRVPVHSLYSETRKPTPAMLRGLDLLVVDLQDVGTRVYTYVWTLQLALEACAEQGVAVLVLDRPNPLGTAVTEGAVLDPAFASFVGLAPLPMRHGLTIGGFARATVARLGLGIELHVEPVAGVPPDAQWPALGRSWVPTSPNLPRFESVLVYPGQVLLEGTNLSEGRGTTTPFEICGAPWLDGDDWAAAARELGACPQAVLRPVRFEPTFHKFAGDSCGGVFVHALDAQRFRPYRTTLALLAAARRLAPDHFRWRQPPYEYEQVRMPIDILAGSARLREAIDDRATAAQLDELAAPR
ncbi:MAG: DUF1343 domain-containing protein [Planctomycetes bacterium]|nr:DUF1343 domain-containing protein [Planctomycetota bacterium]